MAGRTVFFRLGDQDHPTLADLQYSILRISGLLADLDAAVAKDPRGAVRWRVQVLQNQSPLVLGLTAEPIPRRDKGTNQLVRQDTSRGVESALLRGVPALAAGERPPDVPDAAIEKIQRLAVRSKRMGDFVVYSDAGTASISETTLDGIHKVIGSATRSEGSILGSLDTIAVHSGNEIRVWDENSNRAVRCRYPVALEDKVKALLRKRVLVVGLIAFNVRGEPVYVRVEDVEEYAQPGSLPTIEQASGLIEEPPDESFTVREYLEHIRDER